MVGLWGMREAAAGCGRGQLERKGKKMQLPTIHLNGTAAQTLIETLCEASERLEDAYSAIKQTAPNGRDYYPQGAGAIDLATREHLARLQRIDDVKKEIDALTMAIDEIASSRR